MQRNEKPKNVVFTAFLGFDFLVIGLKNHFSDSPFDFNGTTGHERHRGG
jgi:hypothetical protein